MSAMEAGGDQPKNTSDTTPAMVDHKKSSQGYVRKRLVIKLLTNSR